MRAVFSKICKIDIVQKRTSTFVPYIEKDKIRICLIEYMNTEVFVFSSKVFSFLFLLFIAGKKGIDMPYAQHILKPPISWGQIIFFNHRIRPRLKNLQWTLASGFKSSCHLLKFDLIDWKSCGGKATMPYHHLEILWISCLRWFKCQLLNQAYIKAQGRFIPTITKKSFSPSLLEALPIPLVSPR